MDCNWLTSKAETRVSPGKGHGSFATEHIRRGERVAAFGGWVVDRATLNTLPEENRFRSIQIDGELFLTSGPEADRGDYVNHSCAPNCGMYGSVIVVAMRDIEPGEELTFDYAMCDTTDYSEFECRCGADECRGNVTANDWRRPELINRYRGYHSTYVSDRIDDLETEGLEVSLLQQQG